MLILGGTGFIGKHLCLALSARRRNAIVVSRMPDLSFLEKHAPGIVGVPIAMMLSNEERYFQSVNTLVYLASTSVPSTNMMQPWCELTHNVQPAFELLTRAHSINPSIRIVFLSSGGTIYGSGHTSPIPETAPARPISAYGYGKLAVEEAVRYLGRTKGLNYALLRVSNPVGCWQGNRMHGIVNVALRAAYSGEALKLFDGGNQVRDFLDADDLAEVIIAAADARRFDSETWNIGSGVGRTISEVVDIVSDVVGRPIKKINLPMREEDVSYSVLDAKKASMDLDWRARRSLQETVETVNRFWRTRLGAQIPVAS